MKRIIYFIFTILFYANLVVASNLDKIIVKGNKRINTETIKVFSDLNIGEDLKLIDLNNVLKELYKTNFFKDVSLEIIDNNIIISVVENPIIQEVIIKGVKKASLNKKLLDLLTLKNKSSYVDYIAKNDLQKLKNVLRVSGYYLSGVKVLIKSNDNDSINLIYDVALGDKALIEKIKFIGDKKIKDRQLRSIIVSEENKFWKFLSSTKYLDESRIKLDERLLANFYKNKGYYNIKVQSSNAKFLDKNNFELIYNINAGEKFIFNDLIVTLPGDYDAKNFTSINDVLLNLKNTTYSLNKINKILKEIDKLALSRQYEFINAKVETKIIANNKLNFNFIINNSEKFYVEKINITGNNITRENVIRNSFFVDEGDAFNEILHNKTINRLKAKGIFQYVKSKIKPGTDKNLKIIEINVEEKATGEISAGAGVGTTSATFGLGVKENNYLGKGVQLDAKLQYSEDVVKGIFSINNPNFNNTDNSLFTKFESVAIDKLKKSGYKTDITGLSFGTGFEKYENFKIFPSMIFDYESLTTNSTASAIRKKQDGNYFDGSLQYILSYDKRNQSYQPTEGYRSTFKQKIPFISDQFELENQYTFTKHSKFLNNYVGTFSFNAQSINALGNGDVRASKRMFVPENLLRGFEPGKVGPIANKEYIGANFLTAFNYNSTLPFLFPNFEATDFKIFLDAVNLWGVDYTDATVNEANGLRSSFGIGVDWHTPIGPLNFSLAQPITKISTDKTQTFRFNIGTTF
jgi:outer membrane protein insertion porin family